VPDDETGLVLAAATVGVPAAEDLRIARIQNTLEPDRLLVSEPVAEELRGQENATMGNSDQVTLSEGTFTRNVEMMTKL
jgi:hypothetical protein